MAVKIKRNAKGRYKLFEKVLVANRGEIAVRILRACHELGISTVAVYSTADKDALHVQIADEAVCIGGAKSSESYLNMNNVLQAALSTGAEAIHPGFGFLSENAEFAKMVEETGIKWIGPSSEVIGKLGDKIEARATAIKAGAPVIPGTDSELKSFEEAEKVANEMGYPVIIKAAAGGGGRGIRIVRNKSDLKPMYDSCKKEAIAAFSNGALYMEKFIVEPRHIEVQILGDSYGNVVHLFERDCSLQRNNQKLIEEAPSAYVDAKLRKGLTTAAVSLAETVGYENAGTIEFLVDNKKKFYFMEMNTRIQVEHPVTEMITGIDLIKEQIKIAAGKKLLWTQKDIKMSGHSIEIRINAENAYKNFAPMPGKVDFVHFPGGKGIRMDSAMYSGYSIPPFYDSMVGKLIVHSTSREKAIQKARSAIEEMIVDGPKTNIPFQYRLLLSEKFKNNTHNTGYVEKEFMNLFLKSAKK